jgi:hypothetical protein
MVERKGYAPEDFPKELRDTIQPKSLPNFAEPKPIAHCNQHHQDAKNVSGF